MISRKLQLVAFSSLLWLSVGFTAFASQLDQTAVHEASHAVAALAQGGWVEEITIFPDLSGECACFHRGRSEDSIIALAGYAGQRVILNTEDPYGASIDFDIGAQMVGGGLFYLLPRTEQLIAHNQRAILAIAEELKLTRRMSGERARQIFQSAGIAGNPRSQPVEQTIAQVPQTEDCPNTQTAVQVIQAEDYPNAQQPAVQRSQGIYGMVMATLAGALAVLAVIARLNGY